MAFQAPRPTGFIANKGLELFVAPTGNGMKVTILLEELKESYGLQYAFQGLDLRQGVQKEAWYRALNLNGKIPVLVDHDNDDFAIAESLAINTYLLQNFDKDCKFHPADPKDAIRVLQWTSWQNSELGPTAMQAILWYRFHHERLSFPMQKLVGGAERNLGVLDEALAGREYLVGAGKGAYSIADITSFAFVSNCAFFGIDPKLERWGNVKEWVDRIKVRPAVQRAKEVPWKFGWDCDTVLRRLESDEEFARQEGELREQLEEAKRECGYKYQPF